MGNFADAARRTSMLRMMDMGLLAFPSITATLSGSAVPEPGR